jgi:two-component system sensor histidine kinase KdpD
MRSARGRDLFHIAVAAAGLAAITGLFTGWPGGVSVTTIALSYLLLVLFISTLARWTIAVTTSLAATLAIDFFFLPPLYRFTVEDPQNWVDLFAFLGVSLVANHLSSTARARQREAELRGAELGRLFEISRDIIRDTEGADAIALLARQVVERFRLDYAAICLLDDRSFTRYEAGRPEVGAAVSEDDLRRTLSHGEPLNHSGACKSIHRAVGPVVHLAPMRRSGQPIGVLALANTLDIRTRDLLIGLIEMGIERVQFLKERERAQLSERRAELKSTLLASLTHDLATPLTAIRVGVTNLLAATVTPSTHAEQRELVLSEVDHLNQLFRNILEMTRIDAGTIAPQPQWVYPAEIIDAAVEQVAGALRCHDVVVTDRAGEHRVLVDPRLTAYALGRLLENAAQYSARNSIVNVVGDVTPEGLLLLVHDQGAGIASADLPHLFDRFYRGASVARHRKGTGMGLTIARGLLAAEGGRVSAENSRDGGALFSILVPAARLGPDEDPASAALARNPLNRRSS